jgi:interleukin-1 receptor-associated kinase 1
MTNTTKQQPTKAVTLFRGEHVEDELEQGAGAPRRFSYDELAAATDNFSNDRALGRGGFGSVYQGFLSDMNREVAVKRVSETSRQGWKEFVAEVSIISRLRHRNLVQLIGWCHGGDELLLVYELMHNASLDTHLYKPDCVLAWSVRYVFRKLVPLHIIMHEFSVSCETLAFSSLYCDTFDIFQV